MERRKRRRRRIGRRLERKDGGGKGREGVWGEKWGGSGDKEWGDRILEEGMRKQENEQEVMRNFSWSAGVSNFTKTVVFHLLFLEVRWESMRDDEEERV